MQHDIYSAFWMTVQGGHQQRKLSQRPGLGTICNKKCCWQSKTTGNCTRCMVSWHWSIKLHRAIMQLETTFSGFWVCACNGTRCMMRAWGLGVSMILKLTQYCNFQQVLLMVGMASIVVNPFNHLYSMPWLRGIVALLNWWTVRLIQAEGREAVFWNQT